MTSVTTRVPSPTPPLFRAKGVGMTHAGLARRDNEDAVLDGGDGRIWAVADGIGGARGGRIAAELSLEPLHDLRLNRPPAEALCAALEMANRMVRDRAMREGYEGMGATIVVLHVDNKASRITIAWSGDCRAYLLREKRLRQLTRDHSLIQELVDSGQLNPSEAENHPDSSIVTRAIGGQDTLQAETLSVAAIAGDRYLLSSDGLGRVLGRSEIATLLQEAADPDAAVRVLISETLRGGAPDNVSVVVVDLVKK